MKELDTIKLLTPKQLNNIVKNSIFLKNIQIESIINIDFYKSDNLGTEIFLKDDIKKDKYNINIFIKINLFLMIK